MTSIRYVLAGLLVVSASCMVHRQQQSPGDQKMASPADLRTRLEVIERGAWGEWKGLDATWSRSNLKSIGAGLHACRAHELGGRSVQRCELSLSGQSQPLQCFLDAAGQVILLRLEDPRSSISWPALSKGLGPSEQTNLVPAEHVRSPATQHIYAARGLTLYVLELPDPSQSIVVAVSLYAPTSAHMYREALGGDETIEYLGDPGQQ